MSELENHLTTIFNTVSDPSWFWICSFNQLNQWWKRLGEIPENSWKQSLILPIAEQIFQFSSVVQWCPILCDPMECSTPSFPVHHQLLQLAQTHVHRVGDVIQPSHPLSSPSPFAFNISQDQGLSRVGSSHQVAKVLELQLQYQSFQGIFRTDFL